MATPDAEAAIHPIYPVGAMGFFVDAGVLYLCLHIVGLGLYLGRIVSYLAAATATWYLNRKRTFSERTTAPSTWQWLKFITSNGLGGLINYGIYSLVVTPLPGHALTPLLGVALGSIAGLRFNFTLSRYFVFAPSLDARPRREKLPSSPERSATPRHPSSEKALKKMGGRGGQTKGIRQTCCARRYLFQTINGLRSKAVSLDFPEQFYLSEVS